MNYKFKLNILIIELLKISKDFVNLYIKIINKSFNINININIKQMFN